VWIKDWNWIRKLGKSKDWKTPGTTYNLTFSYETNKDFVQRTSLLGFSYSAGRGYNFFRFVPMEWNLNQVTVKSDFLNNLGSGEQVLLSSLLNPNFIPSSRFEWIYNDK